MHALDRIDAPRAADFLVAFSDLTAFSRFARSRSPQELFDTLSDYYEFVGEVIENAGGKVVKFIGDACLIAFTEEQVDEGVLALKELKDAGDAWLEGRGASCRHQIAADFGPVFCGPVGTREDKRFDVFGEAVNTAAVLKSKGFAMTPQVFRRLAPATRKQFKKHTPPITYIPIEENHRD